MYGRTARGSRMRMAALATTLLFSSFVFLASYWRASATRQDDPQILISPLSDTRVMAKTLPLTLDSTQSFTPTQLLAAGGNHACAISERGTFCWGANWDGQLGTPEAGDVCFPHSGELPACSRSLVLVRGNHEFRFISAGGEHTCAIDTENRAFCWGWNGYGQIGGPTADGCVGPYQPTLSAPVNACTYTPVQVTGHLSSELRFETISAGGAHSCGVAFDGRSYCWGRNDSYQTGSVVSAANCDFDIPCNPDPVAVGNFITVTAGTDHSCGLDIEGIAYCWGSNEHGQLGHGNVPMSTCGSGSDTYYCSAAPRSVAGGYRFTTIDADTDHTCGVTEGGDAYCWGRNSFSELGDGLPYVGTVYYTPNLVVGGHEFTTIDTGMSSTCGVTTGGATLCWGFAKYGETGNGQTEPNYLTVPVTADTGVKFNSISSKGLFNCATDGTMVSCWGQNDYGQSGPTSGALCGGGYSCNTRPAFVTGLDFGPPKITNAWAKGSKDPLNPMTRYDVELEAEIELAPGYQVAEVVWSGDVIPGTGNPYTYRPFPGTHGRKHVVATLVYTHTGSGGLGRVTGEGDMLLFFEKNGHDGTDGIPNWFRYWGVEGAVTGLDAPDVKYNPTLGSLNAAYIRSVDTIFLGPGASEPDLLQVEIGGPFCPQKVWGPYEHGVHNAATTLAHERRHEAVHDSWELPSANSCASRAGPWGGCPDSDRGFLLSPYNDRLPDAYEISVLGTSPERVDSCNLAIFWDYEGYKYYGDGEYDARWHELGHKGIIERDWANPGAQTIPYSRQASSTTASGPAGEADPNKRGGRIDGVTSALQSAPLFPGLAALTGSYADAPLDGDGDGAYDVLRIQAGLIVTAPALYDVVGWLQDGTGREIAWAGHTLDLDSGVYTAELDFEGASIQRHGEDGPYHLSLVELRAGEHGDLADQAEAAHVTASYGAADFAPPAVTSSGTYTSSVGDTDGDGFYDGLDIGIHLQLHAAGSYELSGHLFDVDGEPIPGAAASAAFSQTGVITLTFSGEPIRWARADGPYTLRYLQIRDAAQDPVTWLDGAYVTGSYTYDQFQYRGAAINLASFSDRGQDADFDGDYDYVRSEFQIDADQAGLYHLSAALADSEGATLAALEQSLPLSPGANDVTLDFPAVVMARDQLDGPYIVSRITLFDAMGKIVDHHPLAHTTAAYTHSDFSLLAGPLNAPIVDYPHDSDGDDVVDHLRIDVPVSPRTEGMIVVQGRLLDKTGAEIQSVETYAWYSSWYTPGPVFTMTLPFSASLILANGVDGPYYLDDLRVYHTLDPSLGLFLTQAHVTAYYTLPDWDIIDLDKGLFLPLVTRE